MVTLYNIQVTDYILLFVVGISLNVTFNQVLLGSSPRADTPRESIVCRNLQNVTILIVTIMFHSLESFSRTFQILCL